jgi:hypothetical protein
MKEVLLKLLSVLKAFARDIAVVILGVVIALGFNSWAETRSDRRLERSYLSRLARDLRADSILLQRYRANAAQGEAGARLLLTLLDDQARAADDTTVARSFSDATRGALSTANAPTIEELKSTGNLRVIRDAAVRDALLTYYSEVVRLQRTLETVMRRGRDPLAEVGWDIQAFDPALTYAITSQEPAQNTGIENRRRPPQPVSERFRNHPAARSAAARALTYQRFLTPIISDWETQLRLVRSPLGDER